MTSPPSLHCGLYMFECFGISDFTWLERLIKMFNSVCICNCLFYACYCYFVMPHFVFNSALPRTEYITRLFLSSKHKIYVLIKSIIFHFIITLQMKLTLRNTEPKALNLKHYKRQPASSEFECIMKVRKRCCTLHRAQFDGERRVFLGRVVAQIVDCYVHNIQPAIKMQRQHINYCCVYKQVGIV